MQSENGNWPTPAGFDAGFNSIERILELIEKQVEILKPYPNKITQPRVEKHVKSVTMEEETNWVLSQAMEDLKLYYSKNYPYEPRCIEPIGRVRLLFVQWITAIKPDERYVNYIANGGERPSYSGSGRIWEFGDQVGERPGLRLGGMMYTLKHRSNAELMDKLAQHLLRTWPATNTPDLSEEFRPGHAPWVFKRCKNNESVSLGLVMSTSKESNHCTLPLYRAEAIACLLADRVRPFPHLYLDHSFLFLSRYCTSWPSYGPFQAKKREYRTVYSSAESHVAVGKVPVELRFQFHMRSFVPSEDPIEGSGGEGIICDRLRIQLPGAPGSAGFSVVESRRSFDVRCPVPIPENEILQFIFLRVVDNDLFEADEGERDMSSKLNSYFQWAGLTTFQRYLFEDCWQWENEWQATLKNLDLFVGFKIEDIANEKRRQELMYDDRNLSRSEIYFMVLQFLRMFEEWIKDTVDEITKLANKCKEEVAEMGFSDETSNSNWEIIVSTHSIRTQRLLSRIHKRTQDIESLRSGLYNALSVREATRSTRMNQIMLLFTLATILYLPPTFVATFMALDLFKASDKTHFWNIFGGAIGVTYLAAVMALIAIYREETVDTVSSAAKWLSNAPMTNAQVDENESAPSFFGKVWQQFHSKRRNGCQV